MKTIYKYEIPLSGKVTLPRQFEPLTVAMQDDTLCLWAAVDIGSPEIVHQFHVIGTGMEPQADTTYINTVFVNGFVLHVFY